MAKKRGQQPNPDPDDDDESTGELSDAARTEITNLVNAAVSGQLQRKLPKAIGDAIAGPMGDLRTLIESNATGARRRTDEDPEDDDEDPPEPKRKGKRAAAAQPDPEKENMRKRLDTLEAERRTEREQTRNRDRDGQLREHLTKLGVDPNRIRGAIAVLRETTKHDEKTGEWSYVAKRDGFDEEIDLAAGVGEWSKTDEGKSYIAPAQGQQPRGGSGMRPGGTPVIGASGGRAGAGNGDPKAAKQAAKQEAMKSLTGAIDSLAGGAIPLG
jgi:hypothetical protein